MDKWQLTISRVQNGVVITTDNGEDVTVTRVAEEDEGCEESKANALLLRKIVYEVAEYFALQTNKHDSHRWDFIITENGGDTDEAVETKTDYYLR